jgi:hypothetical protein
MNASGGPRGRQTKCPVDCNILNFGDGELNRSADSFTGLLSISWSVQLPLQRRVLREVSIYVIRGPACALALALDLRPALVKVNLRVERCISRVPSSVSSWRACRLKVLGGTPSRRAASAKLWARTT